MKQVKDRPMSEPHKVSEPKNELQCYRMAQAHEHSHYELEKLARKWGWSEEVNTPPWSWLDGLLSQHVKKEGV